MIIEKTYPVKASEPVFKGHFPDNPILPGVMLLSFIKATLHDTLGGSVSLISIDKQKFIKPVTPDCEIKVSCKVRDIEKSNYYLTADCTVSTDEGLVTKLRASFYCSVLPACEAV